MGEVSAIRSESGLEMVREVGAALVRSGSIGALGPPFDKLMAGPFGRLRAGSIGDAGMWFDSAIRQTPARLTMNGGYEYVGSGWWEVGVALVRWDCWVPLGPGRGRRDDGGSGRGTGVGRGLGCVQAVGRMCSVLGPMCPVSGAMCPVFGRMCSVSRGCVHFGGRCVQFPAVRLGWGWGTDGRRDSLLRQAQDRLRQAQGRFFDGLRAGSP